MTINQSYELIRYISNIAIASDGTIIRNEITTGNTYVSDLYTPTYAVSVLARITYNMLNSDKIKLVNTPIEKGTFTRLVLDSDIATQAPNIHLLIRAILLESFSLVYSINEERDNLKYITEKDIRRLKENINYIADYMSTEEKYFHMIEHLRNMYIAIGYIEHQIDVIMNEGRVV